MDNNLRKTLVALIIELSASEILDSDDRRVLHEYGVGLISREQADAYFLQKAQIIEQQIRMPQ
jgi:hypothetical protein